MHFVAAPIPDRGPFDAVVGRCILVHQQDIAATLRSLQALIRPSGSGAFHEVELDLRFVSDPSSDFAHRAYFWLREAFRLGGAQLHVVSQMPRYFYEAGFGRSETQIHPLVGCGPDSFAPSYIAGALHSLAPVLEKAGVVRPTSSGWIRLKRDCVSLAPTEPRH